MNSSQALAYEGIGWIFFQAHWVREG